MTKALVASKRASLKVEGKAEIRPNFGIRSLLCPLIEIEKRRDRRLVGS